MEKINSYKDLLVWQRGVALVEKIYRLTAQLPKEEQWTLVIQLRRAAISVPSNIAEGYGRRSTGEYRHHLSISQGSLLEVETQLIICQRLGFVTEAEAAPIATDIQELSKMMVSLISKLRG